ncbi:phosphatidylcholine:ceramide cholinephosphotransferase 1 [Alosa pseudoharengus]|uniref:phosphatidylcholine:ceramide cholinephosphotransferase 1 n=1 Tax=Alosa pseudoharengus TaxID=34774 RepID=UPI003F8CA5CE
MKKVAQWSVEEVSRWLMDEGMQEYSEPFRNVDGHSLLQLSQTDFQRPPLSLVSSDGGQQLLERVETLRIEHHIEAHKNGHANGDAMRDLADDLITDTGNGITPAGGSKPGKRNGMVNGYHKDLVKIPMPEPTRSQFPTEWGKTAVAFFYAICCFVSTTVMISVVHERVPPKEVDPPLPDKFFDLFDRVEWAFSICEINGIILVCLWLLQWTLLKYKSIVGRRFFFIVGTLYLYRCITMYITTLPVPGMHFRCSPKLLGDWEAQMRRVMKMIAGGGLTITGSHSMCGDYLYSGHTVMLTLTYLFIKEYSPKRFWWYHWACWLMSVVGIFCILLAHDHYTIDVVVAYFITTRLFWWYHTMANQQVLKEPSPSNFISRAWWYRFFYYLEENIQGIIPRNYQVPYLWRPWQWGHVKYTRIDSE